MTGAAMSLTAAASGFVVFLLSVSVVQAQDGWGVTYTATDICAMKGSTVNISCTYTYPSTVRVQETFWHIKWTNPDQVDLKTQSEYSGRVQYQCEDKTCTLTIRDLIETESAEYKFRFITNQPTGRYTGSPGVTLTVTALQVQVTRVTVLQSYTEAELKCLSSDSPAGGLTYVWFQNGQKVPGVESASYKGRFGPGDDISCALKEHEACPSPPVYAPKLLSVSVSPSAEIVEGSSLTLTCSSDAHPAAKHTWYKGNHTLLSKEPQLIFSSIQSTDSGEYYCTAENDLGKTTSKYVLISVKYPWKLPVALTVPAVVLAFMLLPALLWIRRRRSLDQQREAEGGPDNSAQVDQLHYASVQFTRNQEDNIYSDVSPAQHQADKQEGVIYSTVLSRAGSDPRTRRPAAVEDPSSLYSSVNKRC